MSRFGFRWLSVSCIAVWLLQAAVSFAAVPTAVDDAASRTRIRAERQRANAEYAAREVACKQRFVVASCLDDAAVSRRATLERLQEEEAVINERQRAARADIAAGRVAGKQETMRKAMAAKAAAARAAADKPGAPAGVQAVPADPAARSSGADEAAARGDGEVGTAKARKPPTPSHKQPSTSQAPSAAKRQKALKEHDRRLDEATKHRQEVEARNAAKAAQKKPGDPLPPLGTP